MPVRTDQARYLLSLYMLGGNIEQSEPDNSAVLPLFVACSDGKSQVLGMWCVPFLPPNGNDPCTPLVALLSAATTDVIALLCVRTPLGLPVIPCFPRRGEGTLSSFCSLFSVYSFRRRENQIVSFNLPVMGKGASYPPLRVRCGNSQIKIWQPTERACLFWRRTRGSDTR